MRLVLLRALMLAAVALAVIVMAREAQAHDAWWNGQEVDPSTKRMCCGQNDVTHLARDDVRVTAKGYQIDTGETIPFERAQPSPDGEYWRFT